MVVVNSGSPAIPEASWLILIEIHLDKPMSLILVMPDLHTQERSATKYF